ncbi:hypothetical protein Tco_1041687 [Tanacetum coccineum]|uniref:Homologous recombination OB-fold protein OB-fold domain-containing protein n=1 Tax=Tanacetum coccineum TaxID=301880 RepID=A0ABQ5GJ95_9ASTR
MVKATSKSQNLLKIGMLVWWEDDSELRQKEERFSRHVAWIGGKLIQLMHTKMVPEQVKTMKIQAGVQVSRPGELRRYLQLWKCFGRLYFVVIVLDRNIRPLPIYAVTSLHPDLLEFSLVMFTTITPGHAVIIQAAKLLKQTDIQDGGDGCAMLTQEYMKKVVEDMGEDEDFKSGSWVSATDYVNANGGSVSGCLGDIKNFLNNGKLDQVFAIVKSCSLNMIGDLTVTMKDILGTIPGTIHHKVIDDGGYGKDITIGAALILANLQVCGNVTHQEMADEEVLNLALKEEARQAQAEHEWLEKCRQEEELDEEHERQLWGFYDTF